MPGEDRAAYQQALSYLIGLYQDFMRREEDRGDGENSRKRGPRPSWT